jgi:hypothetical protein
VVSWQSEGGAKMILTPKTASSCEWQYIFEDLLDTGPKKAQVDSALDSAQNGLTASMVMASTPMCANIRVQSTSIVVQFLKMI